MDGSSAGRGQEAGNFASAAKPIRDKPDVKVEGMPADGGVQAVVKPEQRLHEP